MAEFLQSADALTFQSTQFDVIACDGRPWLRGPQIAGALGYNRPDRIADIYNRHATEFNDSMTKLVLVPSSGGDQETRIFSLRGAHLLGMFARTARAAEFRRWVLDVLESAPALAALPAPAPAAESLERALADRDALRALLAERVLQEEPHLRKVAHYYSIPGLTNTERARLMGWKNTSSWYEALKRVAILGLVDYVPDPQLQSAGKRAGRASHAARLSLPKPPTPSELLTQAAGPRHRTGRSPEHMQRMRAAKQARSEKQAQQSLINLGLKPGAQRDE